MFPCSNKIDRPGARSHQVVDMVFDLFCELNASDEQLDFPVIYSSARDGYAKRELEDQSSDLEPLFSAIRDHVPPYEGDLDAPFKMLVTHIDYDDYIGRTATGKIFSGRVSSGDNIVLVKQEFQPKPSFLISLPELAMLPLK